MSDPQQTPAPHARRAKNWRRYLQFWGARVEADVDDELQLHAELRMRDYMAAGMPENDARAAAARRIGDLTDARRQCLTISTRRHRRMTRTHTLDAFRQDLRFALRMLARQKAWTAVAVLTLALGIGASAAVFSVMNSVVLHPLPFHDSDRVVTIWLRNATQGMMTTPDHEVIAAWQANNHTFESIQEYEEGTVTLSGAGEAATLNAIWMQPDLPRFAGMPIVHGRSFTAAEAADSNAHVAIISEALWHQRFGSRDVLGSRILLDKTPYVIVGVAPASLRLHTVMVSGPTQVWLPVAPGPRPHWAMGRLRPGVTRDAAQRDLRDITAHVTRSMRSASEGFAPMLVDPAVLTDLKTSATLLSAGVVFLLIIACVNVAHLLLARGASREREISIRRAIGATRSRLARQFVTESCLLAVAGCAAGLALAYGGLRAIIALRPPSLNELAYTRMNGGVLWAAIGVSLTVGVLFALLGTRTGSRDASAESLKATTSAGTGTRRHHRLRATLVITEMALSAMLLVGAALLIRSIAKLERVDPGFDTHNLYTMAFEPPQSSYTPARTEALANELRTRAAGIPGVREVTVASSAPPAMQQTVGAIQVAGRQAADQEATFTATNFVRPDYFAELRIHLRRGRAFDERSKDRDEVIIDEAMATKLWPGQDAIGKRFRFAPPPGAPNTIPWLTIVGVAPNVLHGSLDDRLDQDMMYLPWGMKEPTVTTFWGFSLIVRTSEGSDPSTALHRLAVAADPAMAPPSVISMDHAISETIASRRFTMVLLTIFACVAVALASIGLYGVISYAVAQQRREIGIRIALGALPAQVARLVLTGGAVLVVTGLAIGLIASLWGTRVIRSSLFGVGATDPLSFAAVALLLIALSALACLIPTRRAMRVDPLIAMRTE